MNNHMLCEQFRGTPANNANFQFEISKSSIGQASLQM